VKFNDARFVIAYTIILLFAGAYVFHPSETMNGALIAGFAGAWGYFLGSSSGAAKASDNTGKALDLANGSGSNTKPDVTLKPGETAQAAEE
jgi:hypothetical protein